MLSRRRLAMWSIDKHVRVFVFVFMYLYINMFVYTLMNLKSMIASI